MIGNGIEHWWRAVGGRKEFNGILYALILTYVFVHEVTPQTFVALFVAYGVLLGLGLGITGVLHVLEDTHRGGAS